ncbi:MAG: hypothetical protein QOH67_308 [Hyphomicrobiales bacterium]|jgi:hypothetical protein|nr:hypothetical protein [Hyphomicrobiales bacterium]
MRGIIVSVAMLIALSDVAIAQDQNKASPRQAEERKFIQGTAPPANWQAILEQAGKRRGGSTGVHSVQIWGVGPDVPYGRVYLWNGASWSEPNPTARASEISATPGGAWALGSAGRIFWTTNGTSWSEPNPAAQAYSISGPATAVWAVGDDYRVFLSLDGGKSWFEPNTSYKLRQVSAGNAGNVWGISLSFHVFKYNAGTWEARYPAGIMRQISAMGTGDGAWGIGNGDRILMTVDGHSWSEPNPVARASQISAIDNLHAWAIGNGNRVFMTTDGGVSWSEPNPQAHLKQVSAQ